MPGEPEEDDDTFLFRPPWETDDAEPLGLPQTRKLPPEPDYRHPLLIPLATAQEALTRLETRAEAASAAVIAGLRTRLSYREAAGWLGHAHVWIHPHDLALRDHRLTGSYAAAFQVGQLRSAIPMTIAREGAFETSPSDIFINQALRLAHSWRRLGEMRSWRPLHDIDAIAETLQALGCRGAQAETEIADWRAITETESGPALIRAGRAGRDWMNRPGIAPRNPDSMFLAACLWQEMNPRRVIALPFWTAPEALHHRLELHVGLQWTADFLDCISAAARVGSDELERLQRAEEKGRSLGKTTRSRLPEAFEAVLRLPITTAHDLAGRLKISTQAALALLRQLLAAGLIREATGRASWRAFVLT